MDPLVPRYKNTEKIASSIKAIEYWGDFFQFIQPLINKLDERRASHKRDVSVLMLAIDNPKLSADELKKSDKEIKDEKLRKDRDKLERVLVGMVKNENISIDSAAWKRWHRSIFSHHNEIAPGKFRGDEPAQEKGRKINDVPKGEILEEYIKRLQLFVKNADIHAVAKSWITLYFLICLLPFKNRNTIIALLAHRAILYNNKSTMGHFLLCEKKLIESKDIIEETWQSILFNTSFVYKLEADLTSYLENAFELHVKSCEEAAHDLEIAYKEAIHYNMLSQKEKDEIKYLFNSYYPRQYEKVRNLNIRQKKLLHFAAIKGSYTAKDMNLRLKVDRKTIQRDSKELQEAGLVNCVGKGRSVSYCLAH